MPGGVMGDGGRSLEVVETRLGRCTWGWSSLERGAGPPELLSTLAFYAVSSALVFVRAASTARPSKPARGSRPAIGVRPEPRGSNVCPVVSPLAPVRFGRG